MTLPFQEFRPWEKKAFFTRSWPIALTVRDVPETGYLMTLDALMILHVSLRHLAYDRDATDCLDIS